MSRQKLEKLGLHLPLFPTTSVGSFPKPDYLLKARADFNKGKITEQQLVELERKATAFWIAKQEELDIDVLVDGEMYRGDMEIGRASCRERVWVWVCGVRLDKQESDVE